MALDHGVLNLPLSKRGDTLFGLTRSQVQKAEREQEKARKAQLKADRQQAKELLAMHEAAIVGRHGEKFGVRELRTMLDSWAKWEPAKLVAFVTKFQTEQVSA